MSNFNKTKNLADLSNVKTQLINSSNKKYKSVNCIFNYGNEPVEKIIPIPVKEGESNDYYFSSAKKVLLNENKSGRLSRYCKKYLRASKITINPVVKGSLITGGVLLIISGVGVGAYFLGKQISPGGGSDDGLIKLTFDAMSTPEHPAYFNNDPTLTRLEVKVGKGITFGEAKKLASDLTRVDHIDPVTHEEFVYDTIDKWSDATSVIADDRVLNSDLTVTANYKPEQVKVIVDAGGNTWATIKDGSTDTPTFSTIHRSITLTVNKGATLKQALTISEGKLYEPSAIKRVGGTSDTYEYDNDTKFTFLRDSVNQFDIYPEADSSHPGARTYDDYVIDRDVVLTANYLGTPGGGEGAMTTLNVTFYANNPISRDVADPFRAGTFPDNVAEVNAPTSQSVTSKTVSFEAGYENPKSFKEIWEKASLDGITNPTGKYGTFKCWTDIDGNELDPTDETKKYDIDFSVFAYYQPNFQTDSWDMIKNIAEGGKGMIKMAYGLDNDSDIYNLEKNIEIDNTTYTVRVIGLNVDYQELYQVTDPYAPFESNSSDENIFICARKPAAMTFQFITPYGDPIAWGDNGNRNYLYQEEGCNIKQKLDELLGKLPSDLNSVINTTAKMVNFREGKGNDPVELEDFDDFDFSIDSKLFLIGGYPEVPTPYEEFCDGSFNHNSNYIYAYNESARNEEEIFYSLSTTYTNVYGMAERDIADLKPYWSRWNTFYPDSWENPSGWDADHKYRPNYWMSYYNYFATSEGERFADCGIEAPSGQTYPDIVTPCYEAHYICPAFSIGNGSL